MNIIFKNATTENLYQKYTTLDLDTFMLPDGSQHTACCVVENIPILELAQTAHLKELHADLIKNYRLKNWNFCEQAIEHLLGKWGGELDSYYHELTARIKKLKELDLDDNWSPVIPKS